MSNGAHGTKFAMFFTQPPFLTLHDDVVTRSCFLLPTHEVGTARAAQLVCTHDVSLLLGAEDTKADPKRVGRVERLAPRTDAPREKTCDPEDPTSDSSLQRITKNDSMDVGRVAWQTSGLGI